MFAMKTAGNNPELDGKRDIAGPWRATGLETVYAPPMK
jgi:hypothetical protein